MGNSKNEDNKSLLFLTVICSEVLCLFLLAFGQTEESNCESGCHTRIREVLQFSQTGARDVAGPHPHCPICTLKTHQRWEGGRGSKRSLQALCEQWQP